LEIPISEGIFAEDYFVTVQMHSTNLVVDILTTPPLSSLKEGFDILTAP
jgi:hypothetical protein